MIQTINNIENTFLVRVRCRSRKIMGKEKLFRISIVLMERNVQYILIRYSKIITKNKQIM